MEINVSTFRIVPMHLVALGLVVMSQFTDSPIVAQSTAEITPPDHYFRSVERTMTGSSPFYLLREGRPQFSVLVSDPNDEILNTAAADLSSYMQKRWGTKPQTVTKAADAPGNLIVLSSFASLGRLPGAFQKAASGDRNLAEQAFAIERLALPRNRTALLCLGGSSIGARYATIEILRRMSYDRQQAEIRFDHLRDEPYSTWRAIYINDSAHQANNYDPNLVYPVETYRWPIDKWKRYIDQMAFFRYNGLQLWLVPQMFTPKALDGGGVYDYVRDTLRAIVDYARPRGIKVVLTGGINVSVDAGTLLDTLPIYKGMPVYRYLSPNKPEEKELMLKLWDHWSKALPGVAIWQPGSGDPGGCHEEGCGPETYVDLSIEVSKIIKKNSPNTVIDIFPWQFFGWGTTWPTQMRKDTARVDRGYRYLVSKLDEFPTDTIFSVNLNDFTSEPPVRDAGRGGNTIEYLDAIHRKGYVLHTWTYFVTEGEGWLIPHDKVAAIIKQRDIEARYPIAGGICYTMTPSLNILNQFACAEAYWDPQATEPQIMQRFAEGVFGTDDSRVKDIFPSFDVGPIVGYTFAKPADWKPDYAKLISEMRRNRTVLDSLNFSKPTRFDLIDGAAGYRNELLYYTNLFEQNSALGEAVAQARALVKQTPKYRDAPDDTITIAQADEVLNTEQGEPRTQLENALREVKTFDVEEMKARYTSAHYKIFIDYPTDFTALLPKLVNGFFDAFGADFVPAKNGE
jgi:hypothetical protein